MDNKKTIFLKQIESLKQEIRLIKNSLQNPKGQVDKNYEQISREITKTKESQLLYQAIKKWDTNILSMLKKKNVKFLKEHQPQNSTLHQSIYEGSFIEVKIYIYLGLDINEFKECDFMDQQLYGHIQQVTPLIISVIMGHFEIFQFLMNNGGDPHFLDKEHKSLLMYASEFNRLDIVQYLV